MKDIALSILCVGLMFYNVYRFNIKGDWDSVAGVISFISAIIIII